MSTSLAYSEYSDVINNDEEINVEEKAEKLLKQSRQLNETDTKYNQEAFDLLARAIKLNPYLIDAWLELTECYQRKSDIDGAIVCLENALKFSQRPNKIILRQLSTCIRQQISESQEEKIASHLRSLELSKQALRVDLHDDESYYNLAKAYMCLFFVTECVDQQLIIMSRATFLKALVVSEKNNNNKLHQSKDQPMDPLTSHSESFASKQKKPLMDQSDFLFNFSTVLIYFQEFDRALDYLQRASQIDPEWPEPKVLEENLIDYLKQVRLMLNDLSKNNKKVVKKYFKLVESLKSLDKIEGLIQSDQRRLHKSEALKVKSITLSEIELFEDEVEAIELDGANTKTSFEKSTYTEEVKLLHLKLVNTINYNQAMYLTFIAIDQNYSVIVITIYNLAATRCPGPRDIVTIVEPKIERICVNNLGDLSKVSYKRIDAREFKCFYVNGWRISTNQVSKPQFKVTVLP